MKINGREFSDAAYTDAVVAVSPPTGYVWCVDPAATGWRLRLFGCAIHTHNADDPRGSVCVAWLDGRWGVGDPKHQQYQYVASGTEDGLHSAMRRALRVADAVGWDFDQP